MTKKERCERDIERAMELVEEAKELTNNALDRMVDKEFVNKFWHRSPFEILLGSTHEGEISLYHIADKIDHMPSGI